jgi:hypothetical protein
MTAGPGEGAPLAHADVLVLDYLAALWAASDDLEPALRDELMTTVADYIAMRRLSPGDPAEDPTPILHRLGPPGSLAAAARRGAMPAHLRRPVHVPAVRAAGGGTAGGAGPGSEYAALALLTAGSVVLPGAAPLAGMVLASVSPRWHTAQKAAAWVLAAGPMLVGLAVVAASVLFGVGYEGMALAYVASVVGGFLAAVTLLPGVSGRRTPHPRPAGWER